MSGPAISQSSPSRDSSTIANKDLRKAAILIEQGKQAWDQVKLLDRQVDLLQEQVNVKDSTIQSQKVMVDGYRLIISNHELMEGKYREQLSLKDASIKQLGKDIKKQKRKNFFIKLAGAAAITYLLVK